MNDKENDLEEYPDDEEDDTGFDLGGMFEDDGEGEIVNDD